MLTYRHSVARPHLGHAGLASCALLLAIAPAQAQPQKQPPPPASRQQQMPQQAPLQQAQPPLPDVAGIWIDDTGKGAIEIAPCGIDLLCGQIVWLHQPLDNAGKPLTDGYNPNPSLRVRAICGLQVIGELRPIGVSTWDTGWIYDPKQGKAFDVEIRLRAPDRLQVKGYLGVKFLSETFIWTRASANHPRCEIAPPAMDTQASTRR